MRDEALHGTLPHRSVLYAFYLYPGGNETTGRVSAEPGASPQTAAANDFSAWKVQDLMKLYYSEDAPSCHTVLCARWLLATGSHPMSCVQADCFPTSSSAGGWLMATVSPELDQTFAEL